MQELNKNIVRVWLQDIDDNKEFHYKAVLLGQISTPAIDNRLRKIFHDLSKERIIKSSGKRDGWYKKIKRVEPIRWWEADEDNVLDFGFPRGYDDGSAFGFEDLFEIFPGDLIIISGTSNYGKTAIAVNIMAENIDRFKCVLMGSEYTAADGKISPKFKRRLNRMTWAKWMNENGTPKFTLLPIGSDFEDYVQADQLNIIDWITLPGEYYLIDSVLKSIKDRVGNGIVVAVIQKKRGEEWGEGGERTERYADVYLRIDPFGQFESLITVGKVKAPKSKATGRSWAFKIVDYGANLHSIREMVKCPKCWGKGYTGSTNNYKKCDVCEGKKFINKED